MIEIMDVMIADAVRAACAEAKQTLLTDPATGASVGIGTIDIAGATCPLATWQATDQWGLWIWSAYLSTCAGRTRWSVLSGRVMRAGVDTRETCIATWSTLGPAVKDERAAIIKKHQASAAYKAARKAGGLDKFLNRRDVAPAVKAPEAEGDVAQADLF